jgi:hypothetical protein
MNTTAEPPAERPAEPPAKTHRRTWLIVGAAAVGIGVIALSQNEVKVTSRAPSGGGWTLDRPVNVRGHTRQQAYGPGRSLRKPVQIAPYSKGLGMAA